MNLKITLCVFTVLVSFCVKSKQVDHKFELGRVLFFDKVISGNKNISCATCHNPMTGTSDSLALPVGEGGSGLGMSRSFGLDNLKVHKRVPRNSPALFNLDPNEIKTIFHDGRIQLSNKYPSGIESPAKFSLPDDLDDIFAAQALFPITAVHEMAGQKDENSIANAAIENDFTKVWELVLSRLIDIKEYVSLFQNAYDDVSKKEDIRISHYANAIAHFEREAFRTLNSPFDKFKNGDKDAISLSAKRGYELFRGKAKCSTCHSGNLFTDNDFHSIAYPQIGPGKGIGFNKKEDYGRELFSKNRSDRYKFRTPPLRNIALTAPYGHSGAYKSLIDVINHHINPRRSLDNFNRENIQFNIDDDFNDFEVLNARGIKELILRSSDLPKINLSLQEKNDLVNFLHSLTDRSCFSMSHLIPARVPSNLPVFD